MHLKVSLCSHIYIYPLAEWMLAEGVEGRRAEGKEEGKVERRTQLVSLPSLNRVVANPFGFRGRPCIEFPPEGIRTAALEKNASFPLFFELES